MLIIFKELTNNFEQSLLESLKKNDKEREFEILKKNLITQASKEEFGDSQCNVCLSLSKIYKNNPRDISNEFIKNEKKSIIIFLFVITTLAYFYPVIKHAKNKLDCEAIAKNYIIKNKNIIGINNREIKMISTNFCYGGEEIYEIENLKN